MTTSYDVALKIETSWAKMDVELSLETWIVNDIILYVSYIYSQIKKFKIWNIKRINSKCSKAKTTEIESKIKSTM